MIAHDLPQGMVVLHGVEPPRPRPRSGRRSRRRRRIPSAASAGCWRRSACAKRGDRAAGMAARPRKPSTRPRRSAGPTCWAWRCARPPGCRPGNPRVPSDWVPAMRGLSLLVAPDAQTEAAAIALTAARGAGAAGRPRRAGDAGPRPRPPRLRRAGAARHHRRRFSAGEPLGETPTGASCACWREMAASELAPVPLLAVLKHPMCAGGLATACDWVRRGAAAGTRGAARPAPGAGPRRPARRGAGRAAGGEDRRRGPGRGARRCSIGWREALRRLHQPARACRPAAARPAGGASGGGRGAGRHRRRGRRPPALCRGGGRGAGRPPGGPRAGDGAAAAAGARRLAGAVRGGAGGAAAPSLRGSRGRDGGAHPRVEILGLLEARLLSLRPRGARRAGRDGLAAGDRSRPLDEPADAARLRPAGARGPDRPGLRRFPARRLLGAGGGAVPRRQARRRADRAGALADPAGDLPATARAWRGLPRALRAGAAGWAAALDRPARVAPCARPAPRPPPTARPQQPLGHRGRDC